MLEARLLAHLGAKAPSDIQVDLVRSSLIPVLIVITIAALFLAFAFDASAQQDFCAGWLEESPPGTSCPSLAFTLLLLLMFLFPVLVLALARLRWILWTWRSRNLATQYHMAIPGSQRPGYMSATSALYAGISSVIFPVLGIFLAVHAIRLARQARKELPRSPNQRGLLALSTGQLLSFASIAWHAILVATFVTSPPI
jgi:hypothetical protein